MIKVILFDIDGVLIRPEQRFSQTLSPERFHDPVAIMNEYYGSDLNHGCDQGRLDPLMEIQPFLQRMGWNEGSAAFLEQQYRHEIGFVDQALLANIHAIRHSGIPCYLASNQNQLRKQFLLEQAQLAGHFDGAFISCDLGQLKPHKEFWQRTYQSLHGATAVTKPAEVLFLDDLEANVDGANDFGFQAVRIKSVIDITNALAMFVGRAHPGCPD